MSILCDSEILDRMDKGEIEISPFEQRNLGPNSYDVTLDSTLYEIRCGKNEHIDPFNFNKNGNKAVVELKHSNDKSYIIDPYTLYICSTVEYIRSDKLIANLDGKSSLGRLGLFIHVTAGRGDIGFEGKWTLELFSIMPFKLYLGMKIGQIYFSEYVGDPIKTYEQTGKYNKQDKPLLSRYFLNQKSQ